MGLPGWAGGLSWSDLPEVVARFREVVGTQHFIRELPGIGHYPQLEAPQSVLEACEAFWQTLGAAQL